MASNHQHIYSAEDLRLLEGAFTVEQGKWSRTLKKRAGALADRLAPPVGRLRERIVEIPLVLAALGKLPPGRVADIGGASSLLGLQEVYLGHEVEVIDLRPAALKHPRLKTRQMDLFDNDLPDGYFDAISCISVIEHVGIARYGGSERPDGDIAFMAQLRRLLKPGGTLLLSAPYGRGHEPARDGDPQGYRIYNRPSLEQLIAGFEHRKVQFFAIRQGVWLDVEQTEADTVATSRPIDAIFFAELQ